MPSKSFTILVVSRIRSMQAQSRLAFQRWLECSQL
jgi:hypothetical protein